ncbi:UNVERIFIED_CONTAM: hypothetical protein Scaly_0587500 [Sesamum calycinum]|uniref:Reverse transcriptase Ty1/copia-type domain-containing protein n=1 Tax=Sesamum calycinum TaxID=2727403 RepID=A0AAW2RSR8_9LAMI
MQSLKRKFEVLTIKDNESIKEYEERSCKQIGHEEKACKYKHDQQGQQGQMVKNQQQQDFSYYCPTSSCRETWLTDSGCTNQMKPELNNFRDLDWSCYSSTSKAYRVLNLKTKRQGLIVSSDMASNLMNQHCGIGRNMKQKRKRNKAAEGNLCEIFTLQESTCYGNAAKENGRRVAMEKLQIINENETWELIDEPKHNRMARYETIRLLVALAAKMGQKIHHLDVKSAFVNGVLEEDIYVETHEGV